ncbi:unnamed protein product [Durusdinium trenchii]|uniref:Uncharacterized protein n=1 Tax=Durusdinium trenchii TaxID=1381693 RepID=A0ABP0KZ46_9DINO
MMVLRYVLASLLLLSDPLVRLSQSWGVGDLSFPSFFAGNDTCPAGETCEKTEGEGGVRGVPPRPDEKPQPNGWPLSVEWLIRMSLRMISDAASTSLHYCGTLCASIGLAARWTYWLAVATVALFMLQLLVWTCNWVLIPLFRHWVAFWRYLRGQGQWYELAQIHGVRVFRPKWFGPQGREDWTAAYVQQEVRGRGDGREPFDLLVTDGTAIARLRHGTLRGRTNRFGFKAECDSVHASSHRYYRNQLEGMDCRVQSLRPKAMNTDFDLQDAAGKGPLARCATAAWLCGYSRVGVCGGIGKAVRKGLACIFCSGCLCGNRTRAPPGSGASTPRHENSETESEAEDETSCQAESVAFLVNSKATPLSLVPCQDAARGNKVKLLPSDAEVSSAEDLRHEDGNFYFSGCNHHRALYEGQAAKRTCVYEGCDREVKASKAGLRLCKLHGAKEERDYPPKARKAIALDETAKALQAIAKAVTSKDEAASHDKGKLASIGKTEERLVFLVRGCDALTVSLGKATVGKELFHSLRATSTQGRPQLRAMQFPVNINNRIAYGLASMRVGGKDAKTVPEFCLSAADFPLTSEEEFDNWTGCVDLKFKKRPKPPMTLNAWYRNALREAWAVSCVYGSEHYSAFEQAATYLLKLGEDHAYMWPAHAIFSVWEELWSRYIEELKDLDRELRRAMKEESPTFERIRFFVAAPGCFGPQAQREEGGPVLVLGPPLSSRVRQTLFLPPFTWDSAKVLRSQPKFSESQVAERMESIRKAQQAKNQEMVNEGKKMKKVGGEVPQDEQGTDSKVGECPVSQEIIPTQEAPPEEFTSIHPTDQEMEMAELLEGPDPTFFEDHDRDKPTREVQVTGDSLCNEAKERGEKMGEIDQTNLTEGFGEQLITYVKNQLLLQKEENPNHNLGLDDVRRALEQARARGCPSLSAAADEALQGASLNRAGYSPNVGSWKKDLLSPESGDVGPEARQCLLLHCSAGYLYENYGKVPSWDEVQKQTNEMRKELIGQAAEAGRRLGECPDMMPRSEADLRVFVHDLLHWSHDKDYRTLASFPSSLLLDRTLHVIRMASDGDLSREVITGALSSGHGSQQIHLLVHHGHMRLLVPNKLECKPPIIREVIAAGWECHLEAAHGSEASVRARDYLLCPRCAQPEEVPRRSGNRPPSVLGLHLCSDASERIGEWKPGVLESKDLTHDTWTDAELAEWLGPQADVFNQALDKGLDFLEVYAGKARASHAVLAHGGLALYLGLDHGQDFRKAQDRSVGRALVRRLRPRHLWGAFPCTPFCAWIRLAILRNCDMTLRLKEGRMHLRYILDLCGIQVDDGREAHLENPLTSLAWKEPLAVETLARLHLKPTLIRATHAAMQVLAAVEACYGFHLHTAYLRTYHNVVADALTRKDADEVIREVQFIRLGALAEGYTAALLAI